ncbi:nitronate monooxygenase [Babesia caballi]|uniref:Nitronate monooxygenase n=1 Tax=Babesia caballi TaxID=5871 RepID=A0AAV4LXF7_BABCB|nr:nitronate monooxygenase [Babesia caballi]
MLPGSARAGVWAAWALDPRCPALVGAEALADGDVARRERRVLAAPVQVVGHAGEGDHRAVVDAVALVHGVQLGAALLGHGRGHLLQAQVAAHAAHHQELAGAREGHGALGDLHEHGEHVLLHAVAEVAREALVVVVGAGATGQQLLLALNQVLAASQQPAERAVHALDDEGERHELRVLGAGGELDGETGRGLVGETEQPRQAVKHVAGRDVESLAQHGVDLPLDVVREHLGVAARDVQDDGVLVAAQEAAHLDMADAVVDRDDGGARHEVHGLGRERADMQRRAHAGPPRVADER